MSIAKFSTLQLHWHKGSRSFTQEASTLGYTAQSNKPIPGEIFLQSHKTGQEAFYVFDHIIYTGEDEDREIGGWEYRLCVADFKRIPNLIGVKIVILND